MSDIPRWAKERRDNTKFKRKAALFDLLQAQVTNNMYIEEDELRIVFRLGINQLKDALNTAEGLLFADLKKRLLIPIFSDVSNSTELSIAIIEEYSNRRKVDVVAVEVSSETRACADVINEISAFLNK